jgi:hypothetical protein
MVREIIKYNSKFTLQDNSEFLIKDTYIKYFNWLRKQILGELDNNLTIKNLNYLLKNNDFIHLLCLHLYNIKKIILQNTINFDLFLSNIVNYNNNTHNFILNMDINEQNYNILIELLNHKEFSSLNCCYEKEYYFRGIIKTMKLEL